MDTSHDLDLVTLFSSSNVDAEMEATAIHTILQAYGVPSVLVGASTIPVLEFQVQVPRAELDEARTFLEGVLFSVAAGVVVLDQSLLVRSWNKGAEELWGLRAEEVRNQAFFNLVFGLPTGEIHGIVQECLATGQRTGPVHLAAVNRIGRSIICTVTCSPLKSNGAGEGAVLLMEEQFHD